MNFVKSCAFYSAVTLLIFACGNKSSQEGDQLFSQGKYEEAITQYTQYIEYNPDDIKSIYNRGRAYEELGQYEKSMADYEKALEVDPKNVNALMSIGKIHFREGEFGDAAFYFDKAIKVRGGDAEAHFLSARANHRMGETGKAMEGYNQAISMNSNYGEAFLYRGALKVFLKKKSSGCSDLKKAQALEVPDAEAALQKYCN